MGPGWTPVLGLDGAWMGPSGPGWSLLGPIEVHFVCRDLSGAIGGVLVRL